MWDQKLFELFATGIPQGFAFVLLFFSLVNIKIEKKIYIISSIIFAVLAFLIRPYVDFGVHSVILLIVIIFIAVEWGKSSIISSFFCGAVCFFIAYACEWLTFIFLEFSKFDMELLDTNPHVRTMIGFIPLSVLFAVALTVCYTKARVKSKGTEIKPM